MKIIIVDDDGEQRKENTACLREIYPFAKISAFEDPALAFEELKQAETDLIMLETVFKGRENGIDFAVRCRQLQAQVKILFCTDSREYAFDAFTIHADGYLLKPVSKRKLQSEMEYLFAEENFEKSRQPDTDKNISFCDTGTGGTFDVFSGTSPVYIHRQKSREVLKILSERRGAWLTNREIAKKLWPEYTLKTDKSKYVSLIIKELLEDLERAGIADVVEQKRGRIRLKVEIVNYIS